MKSKLVAFVWIGFLFIFSTGCSINLAEAISQGKITQEEFNETISIQVDRGLIFLPVTIHGKQYRFLFDTGAPFGISQNLQKELGFETVTKSNINDSDNNKKQVDWVRVSSVFIGGVEFSEQVAFVGDFEANPYLKCLNVDGIIGSNLIRQCNWTIDQDEMKLSFFSKIDSRKYTDHETVPFKTDFQYNLFIDPIIGKSKIKNVLVDYGSIGSVSLNDKIFNELRSRNDLGAKVFSEKGFQQSGIVGKAVELNRSITYTDSLSFKNQILENVMVRTGKTVSVGNGLLSRYHLTIDWDNKNLYIAKNDKNSNANYSFGLKMGYSLDKGVYVLSVIEGSDAFKKGVRSDMKVVKIDDIKFEGINDFCQFVEYETGDSLLLQLIDSEGNEISIEVNKTLLYEN